MTPFPDLYNASCLERFLRTYGVSLRRPPGTPIDANNAPLALLDLLASSSELRRRFPRALSEPDDFACWLAHEADLPADAVSHLLAALERRPGQAVIHWYDHDPLARSQFPLAFTPCERGPLLDWLFRQRDMLGLRPDEILWFAFEMAEDPGRSLAALYRRHPEWQRAVPNALTTIGWESLRSWIARRYRVDGSWLRDAILPASASPSRRGVNVFAHFRYPSGVQVAASNTVAALRGAGWEVSCRDVPTAGDLPGRDGFLGLHPFPVTISHLPPQPHASNAYAVAGLAQQPDTYRIGYWYWELDTAPRSWRRHARWLHEIWAPTRFIADAVRGVVPLPVLEVPPGIVMPRPTRVPRSRFGLPDDRFLFLFAFDMNSTIERKNPLGVVAAFRRAFQANERVGLVIKVSRGAADPAGLEALRAACESGRIFLIDEVMMEAEVHGLMAACDSYVSLHRSEGFGLTMAEAMALGKPVIATAYSGNLDFMNDDNSLLVSYRPVPVGAVGPFYRGGAWAEPSIAHAADLMRWVVAHPQAARALGEQARVAVQESLSLEHAARRMMRRLEAIADERGFELTPQSHEFRKVIRLAVHRTGEAGIANERQPVARRIAG
jgi:glycosyltransferase involved in cell wall biosynthesis